MITTYEQDSYLPLNYDTCVSNVAAFILSHFFKMLQNIISCTYLVSMGAWWVKTYLGKTMSQIKQPTVPYITLLYEGEANKQSYITGCDYHPELSNIEHTRLHSEKHQNNQKTKLLQLYYVGNQCIFENTIYLRTIVSVLTLPNNKLIKPYT